jgi:hypothetical protein
VGGFIKSKGGEVLNSFKTKAQIYKNIYLDYSLLSPVVTGSTYAASKLKVGGKHVFLYMCTLYLAQHHTIIHMHYAHIRIHS